MINFRFWFALTCCIALTSTLGYGQQIGPGQVLVIVTDAQTHAPLANADVFLLGADQPVSSLTDGEGRIAFRQIMPGTYRVAVLRDGYNRYELPAFDVDPHSLVTLSVSLIPSHLRTIAKVIARPSVAISSQDINSDSALRQISPSLLDALGKLAGVSIDDMANDGDSAFNVSLHNHDASQTAYSIGGIRVVGPAGGLVGGAQNLFTGASVSFTPTAGYLGGSVNLQTLRPTKLWTYDFKNTVGNYGSLTTSLSSTGTKGPFAFAAQHVFTRSNAFASGLTYEDQSGETYQHDGHQSATGDLLKIDYTVNKRTSASFSGMFTNTTHNTLCGHDTTILPCGYGPGASDVGRDNQLALSVTSLVGNVDLLASAFSQFGNSSYSYPDRTFDGQVYPYFSHSNFDGRGIFARGSVTARRHTDSASLFYSQFSLSMTRPYSGEQLSLTSPSQLYREVDFSNETKANDKLALTNGFSIESATDAGTSLVIGETADWTPGKNDAVEASISAGTAQPIYGNQMLITDALSADIDCHNRSIYVDGPSDTAVPQSSMNYDLTWRHSFRGGSINVDVYRQDAFGQGMRVAVPILAEPDSIFADGRAAFLQQLRNVWSSPGVCGSAAFSANNVYVSQLVAGLGQVYQGYTVSGKIALGRNVMAFPTYALGSTFLSAIDPRLNFPGSYYTDGGQLPMRPLRTAGVTFDGVVPHSRVEWLANAQFTSINNPHNLPAYTTYSAGLVFRAGPGMFTVLESNIFGTHAGLFTTYQGVNPMPTVGGGTFAFSSTPLAPRQFLMTWTVRWRQHTSPVKRHR